MFDLVLKCKLCGHEASVTTGGKLISKHDAGIIAEFADLLAAHAKTHVDDGKCLHEFEPVAGVETVNRGK